MHKFRYRNEIHLNIWLFSKMSTEVWKLSPGYNYGQDTDHITKQFLSGTISTGSVEVTTLYKVLEVSTKEGRKDANKNAVSIKWHSSAPRYAAYSPVFQY